MNVGCGVGLGVGGADGAVEGAAEGLWVGLPVGGWAQCEAPGMPAVDWPAAHALHAVAPLQYVPAVHGGEKRPALQGGQ